MKKAITHTQIHAFNRLYYKIAGLYARFDNALGVNVYLYKVLYALAVSDLHTQKDIAQSYEMPKQTINNVILSLQKQGFIEVQTSPIDKREKLIYLTQSGTKYTQDFITQYTDFERQIYEKIGAKKLEKLIELFSDFEVAFSEVLGEIQVQNTGNNVGQSAQSVARIAPNQQIQNKQNGDAK